MIILVVINNYKLLNAISQKSVALEVHHLIFNDKNHATLGIVYKFVELILYTTLIFVFERWWERIRKIHFVEKHLTPYQR